MGFSIWQYSRPIPAKCASQRSSLSPVSGNSRLAASKLRSRLQTSVPITSIPSSVRHGVEGRVTRAVFSLTSHCRQEKALMLVISHPTMGELMESVPS